MSDWQICGSCGDVHPTESPSATLLLQYTKQNRHDGKLSPADAEALQLVAKCVHAQLYAMTADMHNLQLELLELRARTLDPKGTRPAGSVTDSGTQYAVCKRNGEIINSPALDVAVQRFDNMQAQAGDLGFDSCGASVISREWATYTTDWATVPEHEICQARDRLSGPQPEI